jgi:hypothetical protein
MYEQLTLFPETKEEILEREIISLRKEVSSIRKGIYAKHSELQRKYDSTIHELETLKIALCRSSSKTLFPC